MRLSEMKLTMEKAIASYGDIHILAKDGLVLDSKGEFIIMERPVSTSSKDKLINEMLYLQEMRNHCYLKMAKFRKNKTRFNRAFNYWSGQYEAYAHAETIFSSALEELN